MTDLGLATLLVASGTAAAVAIGLVRYRFVLCSEPSRGPNGQIVHNLYLGIEPRGGFGGPTRTAPADSDGAVAGARSGRGVHVYVVCKR